jgi:autophagy-related protein 9
MQLYTMKLTIFIEELLSVFFTPFILYFSLPKCSERIIDFFREFTVHIDGVGYVCSFGMFDFKKPGVSTPFSSKPFFFR